MSPRALTVSVTMILCSLASTPRAAENEPVVDPKLYQALEYRCIGPFRGGRVTAVTGVRGSRETFFMGSTGGGVWRTTDAGTTWLNVSDGHLSSAAVGAVEVAPSDPNVVWVGTGSTAVRGNISPGDGVYRSTDGGDTWAHSGLGEAGQVGRIRAHPRDADVAYVAALGHIFGANPERGVFRTVDGGATWEKVLHVSEEAGAVDLAMDPANPRILYAATWHVRRSPWSLSSGGAGSGLHRSTDGGDTWAELSGGLPEGTKGRIGVAVSAARPKRVWALVEAEDGGLFRSDDGGTEFHRVSTDRNLRQRAWYYTRVYADPADADTVWVVNVGLWRSSDGGVSFETVRAPHGDHHDLWINPDDSRVVINGNDGGANVSFNGGRTWSTQANQPTAEMYRVTVDAQFPYRVYGCQQDNSCVSVPSQTASSTIDRQHWYEIGGCESGHVAVDPRSPNITYAGCYGGTISRHDHVTEQDRQIMAYPQMAIGQAAADLRYRFQWNAPIRLSPHDPDVLYHCSQFVHRSTDSGQSWQVISPDLTRDDAEKQTASGGPLTKDNTGVEVYDTVFAFEESPIQAGLLWAGSDDGLVHLSRDNGATWEDVTPESMPEWAQVNTIELSPHSPGRAFLAVTRYRLDDFSPYVFRTDDFGSTWTLISDGNGIPASHFARVVREDPNRRGLLYAGTEFGLYVSFDDGARWQSLQLELPVTPITDLAVSRQDLVVATQGRSFWILDDLAPLHELLDGVTVDPAHLFTPRAASLFGGGSSSRAPTGAGANPPAGAVIHYALVEELTDEEELMLDILDGSGQVLRTFSSTREERRAPNPWASSMPPGGRSLTLPGKPGMNRYVWDLRLPDAELVDDAVLWGRARGPRVAPGTYGVRLSLGEWSQTNEIEVVPDPRVTTTPADYSQQFELARSIWDSLSECHRAITRSRDVRAQIEALISRLAEDDRADAISAAGEIVIDALTAIEDRLHQSRSEAPQDTLNYQPQLDNQLLSLLGVVDIADAPPTAGAVERYQELRSQLDAALADLEAVLATELEAFNTLLRDVPAVIVQ